MKVKFGEQSGFKALNVIRHLLFLSKPRCVSEEPVEVWQPLDGKTGKLRFTKPFLWSGHRASEGPAQFVSVEESWGVLE